MRSTLRYLGAFALAVSTTTACSDNLVVKNLNNPDFNRVYSTPSGVEGVVSTLYRSYHQATQGAGEGLSAQSKPMSLEGYGQVANFGMALRGGIPRDFIDNARANATATGNNANWSSLSRLMRNAATVTQAVDAYLGRTQTLGSAALDQRSRAFAFFVNGLAMATLSLGYDSVAVATPATPTSAIPLFVDYQTGVATGLEMLDSAIAIISNPAIASSADAAIPAAWLAAAGNTNPADFVRLIRSYKARFRAGVARTPAERAAVDWALVVADAQNGITTNHTIALNPTTGWSSSLDAGTFQSNASWHQTSLMYLGVADTTPATEATAFQRVWAAPAYRDRVGMNVLVRTPDLRWPQGATRGAQNTDTALPLKAGRYLVNRVAGEDQPDLSNPWGTSQYDNRRWRFIVTANNLGTYVFFPKAELDLLQAEGHIRRGNAATAMPLINLTRVANGLPAFTDANGVAPGGQGCVPRMPPTAPVIGGQCGSLLEALKYEKRMETQLVGYMQWFIDSRGWGDLVQGTQVHWPVPYQEMDTRNQPFYNMPSGTATQQPAGVGTYGY